MQPRDVECPHCGAKIDHGCRSAGGWSIPPHMKRWKAIGVSKPTQEQRDAAHQDGVVREIKIREQVFARLRRNAIA